MEEDFLGSSNAKLVNLDALVDLGRAPVSGAPQVGNPFAMLPPEPTSKPASNPFLGNEPPRPTLNQMRDFSHPGSYKCCYCLSCLLICLFTDALQTPLIPSGLPPPAYQAPQTAFPPPAYQAPQTAFPPVQAPQTGYPPVQAPQSSFSAPQTSQASDLASLFQTPSVPPSYGFPNPPSSGFGQTQSGTDYSAFQTALTPNQSVFGTGQTGIPPTGAYPSNQSVFGSGQVATGPPAYSAFQTTPVPPGPTPGANYGAGSSFPQSSNPFF